MTHSTTGRGSQNHGDDDYPPERRTQKHVVEDDNLSHLRAERGTQLPHVSCTATPPTPAATPPHTPDGKRERRTQADDNRRLKTPKKPPNHKINPKTGNHDGDDYTPLPPPTHAHTKIEKVNRNKAENHDTKPKKKTTPIL